MTTPRPARAIHSDRRARYRHLADDHVRYALAVLEIGHEECGDLALRARVALARWRIYDHLSLGICKRPAPDYLERCRKAMRALRYDRSARAAQYDGRLILLDVLAECEVGPMRSAADNPSMAGGAR